MDTVIPIYNQDLCFSATSAGEKRTDWESFSLSTSMQQQDCRTVQHYVEHKKMPANELCIIPAFQGLMFCQVLLLSLFSSFSFQRQALENIFISLNK